MIRASHPAKKAATKLAQMSRSHRALNRTTAARLTALQRSDLPMGIRMAMLQPVLTKARAVVPVVALVVVRPAARPAVRQKAQVASSQRVHVRVDSAAETLSIAT